MNVPDPKNAESFLLADWRVEPARNRLSRGSASETIENKAMDVLVLLASRAGEVVSADELIAAVWGDQPMGDNPIYKTVTNLRKALGDNRSNPKYIETIPRRGYRLIADISATKSNTNRTRPKYVLAAAVLIVLFAALFVWSPGDQQPDQPQTILAPENSIAVLAFENLSNDADNEYFCRGVAEELINSLAQIPALRVTARETAFSYASDEEGLSTFANRLNVRYLVTGSVRRDDDDLRVTAKLIRADGEVLWSNNYDRIMDDVFAVQEDIAASVVSGLSSSLDGSALTPHRGTDNVDAYTAYFLGRDKLNNRGDGWRGPAIEAYSRAIKLDPDYAAPHAGLAMALIATPLPTDAQLQQSSDLINRALELDPNLAEAHAAAGLRASHDGVSPDHELSARHLRRALELNPSLNIARNWLASSLRMLGQWDAALKVLEDAVEIDPLNTLLVLNLGVNYTTRGEFDKAREQGARAIELPNTPSYAWTNLAALEREAGRLDAGLEWLKQGLRSGKFDQSQSGWEASWIALSYAQLGMHDAAARWLDRVVEDPSSIWRLARQSAVLVAAAKYDELGHLVDTHLQVRPADGAGLLWSSEIVSEYLVRVGRYDEAIDLVEHYFSAGIPNFNGPGGGAEALKTAQFLAVAYRAVSRPADAERVLRAALELQQQRELGLPKRLGSSLAYEAATLSLLGEDKLALQRLQEAAEAGWREYYFALNNPIYTRLFEDPAGAEVFAEIKHDVDVQRERVLAEERLRPFEIPERLKKP